MKRYEPRTPGTKRALLKAVINNLPSKRPDENEKNMMHVEELMRKYEQLAGEGLPDDLRITVFIDLCTKDLRERLEHGTKDILHYKGNSKGHHFTKGKGKTFSSRNGGKGEKGKGKYSGIATDKSEGKGTGGKGYSEEGSGKGCGQFNGTCHWCGEWGHSQSRCRWEDEYMEWVRRTRAEHTHNVEEEEDDAVESANLESLEVKRGEWRALCSLGASFGHRRGWLHSSN